MKLIISGRSNGCRRETVYIPLKTVYQKQYLLFGTLKTYTVFLEILEKLFKNHQLTRLINSISANFINDVSGLAIL